MLRVTNQTWSRKKSSPWLIKSSRGETGRAESPSVGSMASALPARGPPESTSGHEKEGPKATHVARTGFPWKTASVAGLGSSQSTLLRTAVYGPRQQCLREAFIKPSMVGALFNHQEGFRDVNCLCITMLPTARVLLTDTSKSGRLYLKRRLVARISIRPRGPKNSLCLFTAEESEFQGSLFKSCEKTRHERRQYWNEFEVWMRNLYCLLYLFIYLFYNRRK